MPNQKQIVVVVEDDAGMKQAIERLLNAAGFQSLMFPSAEALLLASDAATHAACLVLDVHLPGLSGFQLYQRLRQGGADRPVIFISAYEEPDSQNQAKTAGAIAFLTKPFKGENLIAAINRALGDKFNQP